MLGERPSQFGMFSADQQYVGMVSADSFHALLARHGRELFRDEDYAALYCPDNGRNSVPPSLLCIALLLQAHDRVSDAEATSRALFDLRWKVAMGLDASRQGESEGSCEAVCVPEGAVPGVSAVRPLRHGQAPARAVRHASS